MTVKNGDLVMNHHYFVIGQFLVGANQPGKVDVYVCKDNEIKLFTYTYDLQTDEFLELRYEVVFIILRDN